MMRQLKVETLSAIGRWTLLLLVAGHLLLRQKFAHQNLGKMLGLSAANFLSKAYITEIVLLLLFPFAACILWRRITDKSQHPPGEAMLRHGLGRGFCLGLALLGLGVVHAGIALFGSTPNLYLIARQSVMTGYVVVFLYTFLFFGDQARHIRQAACAAVVVSLLCAGADTLGWLKPPPGQPGPYPDEAYFGQLTLPIATLGLGLLIIYNDSLLVRAVALAALLFAAWRQSLRVPQSVVPIGIGGALMLYLLLGGALALRRQFATLKRAVLLAAFFGILFLGYRAAKKLGPEQSTELKAWSVQTYQELFKVHDGAIIPLDPKHFLPSPRAAGEFVRDPEAYRLNAVYQAAYNKGGPSVVNNIWRLLMWRRMMQDWQAKPVLGAGVGKAWDYNQAFYHTGFHYEEDPGGLNPHNSYMNFLYRYGAVGIVFLLALLLTVFVTAWKALALPPGSGDALLEGIVLYFGYVAIFAFFTVTLEGPSYALPFWCSLGLLYARARQMLAGYLEVQP